MLRRELSKVLVASAGGALVLASRARAQSCSGSATPNYPTTGAETAAGITPTCTGYPPGSVLRYGADPTGASDSHVAFNNALKCNARVFDDYPGGGRYIITGTIQLQRTGQILQGQGYGESASLSGTSVKYTGSSGGIMLSFSNGSQNLNDCVLDGFFFDGNSLANMGLQLYNDSITGGSWRNTVRNCAVWNVTAGTNPTAVYFGLLDAAPSFANDSVLDGVWINNTARGFSGRGAIYRMRGCSVLACSDAAIHAEQGSVWDAQACVFSTNNRDFDGSNIQQFTASGCWFENSTLGIYRAASAHSVAFTGCFLHTFDTSLMMDFGDAAGYHFLGGNFIPTGTKSLAIVNVNPTATGEVIGQGIPMSYAGTGANVPLILPAAQTGTGAVRSASGTLSPGQQLILSTGRGTFLVGVDIWWPQSANVRSQATYSAFLFDGDNEGVVPIASRTGSGGGQSYTLTPSTNGLTLTNTGSQTVNAFISASGVIG